MQGADSANLVEFAIRTVLDELKGNVGPILDPGKFQSTNIYGDTCLGAPSFKIRNGELVTTVGGVKIVKRAGVLDGRNQDPDCGKGGMSQGNGRGMRCGLTSPDRMSSGVKNETAVEREGSTSSCVVVPTYRMD